MVHGDSELEIRSLGVVDHVITDPPYSDFVHRNAAGSHRTNMTDGNGYRSNASMIRRTDLGFKSLDPATQLLMVREWSRLCARWCLVFADEEGGGGWRDAVSRYPMDYVRTVCWDRDNTGSPQFTGDRPAVGHEVIVCAHARGKKRWNGGGKRGIYRFPVVLNYGSGVGREVDGRREHTTQKPLDLMLALVSDFTDPGDLILDPFAGSGTTGVAALRLGRRCILIEKDPKYAVICVERMRAEESQSTLAAQRAGQLPLLG